MRNPILACWQALRHRLAPSRRPASELLSCTPAPALIEPLERRLYLGGILSSALDGGPAAEIGGTADPTEGAFPSAEQAAVELIEPVSLSPAPADGVGESPSGDPGPVLGAAKDSAPGLLETLVQPALTSSMATNPATTTSVNPIGFQPLGFIDSGAEAAENSDTVAAPGAEAAAATVAPAAAPTASVSTTSALAASTGSDAAPAVSPSAIPNIDAAQLDANEVETLLQRASLATDSENAIIAIVDRNGRILGVRAEADVVATFAGRPEDLVFAVDGAVAKARTAAMFSNGDAFVDGTAAPLTSRTVRFLSQSTITEREVNSNPNDDSGSLAAALASTDRGPGFVAPIGVGGHFPPEVVFTPPVDLFAIEHTNRDSNDHPGADGVRGTGDDFQLRNSGVGSTGELLGRFNIDPSFVPAGQELFAPESFGSDENSGLLSDAQSRGIATLPGGLPIFKDTNDDGLGDTLVGGIGVFFPGPDGFASFEQNFVPGVGQTEFERTNAPLVLESEFIAFAAIGGSAGATPWFPNADVGDIGGVAAIDAIDLPFGRLDLVGITLEVVGPGSSSIGVPEVLRQGAMVGPGVAADGTIASGPTDSGADLALNHSVDGFHRDGLAVPQLELVTPHSSTVDNLTAADVQLIIDQAIEAADETRAAVRLPLGSRTKMVFAITDTTGEVLGLYRMGNATTFSIDVAVAKARNVAYYADAGDLQAVDQAIDGNGAAITAGTAFTNRTFRFLALPRYPSSVDGTPPAVFSTLNDGMVDPLTAENGIGGPATVADFDSVLGADAFFPMTNFRDPGDAGVTAAAGAQPLANQNGVVFFPGSIPLYKNGVLVGGFGVSGDGVDQDDVVTFLGAEGFRPPDAVVRADETIFNGVRLPFQKFLRNPFG